MQNLIATWAQHFVKMFKDYSPSKCRYPKLHSWRYHTVSAIREYRSLNGLNAETYESLHKFYVKELYRATNKKNVNDQMLRMVSKLYI